MFTFQSQCPSASCDMENGVSRETVSSKCPTDRQTYSKHRVRCYLNRTDIAWTSINTQEVLVPSHSAVVDSFST